jgi:hypothetical protein
MSREVLTTSNLSKIPEIVVLEAQLQIHVTTVFALHTGSQIFGIISKVTCVASMSSKSPPLCTMI